MMHISGISKRMNRIGVQTERCANKKLYVEVEYRWRW